MCIRDSTSTGQVTCPVDVTVNAASGECGISSASVTLGTPTTADNCGVASVTNDAPATFLVGTTVVTWTVTDNSGNTATCTQDVTVTDNQNPTITCPSDVTVNAAAGECGISSASVTLGTPTTADNCGVASVTNDAPATFLVGTTTVTWTVTDNSGNTATCTQDVTVTDNQNPTITCPTDITVNAAAGECGISSASVTLGAPTTSDNCGVASISNNAPDSFPVGLTPVIWTVTDNNGNTATCIQNVTVVDNQNPTITSPADVTINAASGECGISSASVTLGTPTTADNCGVASVTNDAPATFPVGPTIITWTVTDINGNAATSTQNVTVIDNQNPTITCPADVTVNAASGQCEISSASVTLGTPTTADNCGVASVTNDAPATFLVGTTVVTWTVTDNSGNTATCTQDVLSLIHI